MADTYAMRIADVEKAECHFPCSTCKAKPGEPCKDEDGNVLSPHFSRMRLSSAFDVLEVTYDPQVAECAQR